VHCMGMNDLAELDDAQIEKMLEEDGNKSVYHKGDWYNKQARSIDVMLQYASSIYHAVGFARLIIQRATTGPRTGFPI